MGTVKFVAADDAQYVSVRDIVQSGIAAATGVEADPGASRGSTVTEEEQDTQELRMYFPGGPDDPQLFEVRVQPGGHTQAHAHDESEIIYVLSGDIEFGARSFPAGSAINVPGRTLYSFRAGPNGLRFLNFRGRRDFTFISKDDFMAEREQRHVESE
ncbi:MAG: cupin protein [Acidimicrobiia bacterium]|nr:cupin protein [Acidimicrobiia bacterium]